MKRDVLQALLHDVRLTGSAQVQKKKLLWMLDRVNESASAWALLLEEWVEIGGERNELYGIWLGEHITLLRGTQKPDQISQTWAK